MKHQPVFFAVDVINIYLDQEKTFRSYLRNAHFVAGKREYGPYHNLSWIWQEREF